MENNKKMPYSVLKSIYENFNLDKDFEYCKDMHEAEYNGLTFKDVKKSVFNALLTNKDNFTDCYIDAIKSDLKMLIEDFGEDDDLVQTYKKTVEYFS